MYKVSPSKIASYYYHECEKHLVYNMSSKEALKNYGIQQKYELPSPILKGGEDWEREVIQMLGDNVSVASNARDITKTSFTVDEFKNWLLNPTTQYIYQPTVRAVPSFYERYGIDTAKLQFTECRPDLIEACPTENGWKFRVIDIKSSEIMKISHRVQVILYGLLLQEFMVEHKVVGEVDFEYGGVWTYKQEKPSMTNLSEITSYIESFLIGDLQRIIIEDVENLFWHIDFRCEWCEYFDHCNEKAVNEKHISMIPYLPKTSGQYIKDNNLPATLYEMNHFINNENFKATFSKSISLKSRMYRMESQINALLSNEVIKYGSYSQSMPVGENIALFMTIHKDQVTGEIYAISVHRKNKSDIFDTPSEKQHFIAGQFEDCETLQDEFIQYLYSVLQLINDYNIGRDWAQKKSLQTYFLDNYEFKNLLELLKKGLKRPHVAEMAMQLLFYYHNDLVADLEEHPDHVISFPAVILTSTISNLYAMPAFFAYKIEDLADMIIPDDKYKPNYRRKEYLMSKLSNALKADIIHQIWTGKHPERIEWLQNELDSRLKVANGVVNGIRKLSGDELVAWPEKFIFPINMELENKNLSKLAFMTKYEGLLNCLEIRDFRHKPVEERVNEGKSIRLKYLGDNVYEIINFEQFSSMESGNYLFTEDSQAGELEQLKFKDMFYKNKFYGPKASTLAYADFSKDQVDVLQGTLRMSVKGNLQPIINEQYILSPRFTDWTSDRVEACLKELDERNHPVCMLLDNMQEYYRELNGSIDMAYLEQLATKEHLTENQVEGLKQFVEGNLTNIWGPPGTGKTHFIAAALKILIALYEREGKILNILISGFTHFAIENVLLKLNELIDNPNVEIAKVDKITNPKAQHLNILPTRDVFKEMEKPKHKILGMTLYNVQKVYKDGGNQLFDVVVLDEASQIRTADSLLALCRVKKDGRLMLVGDHYQLPPIIKGKYESEESEYNLFDSIYKLLIDQDVDKRVTVMLKYNFRMNEVLCKYSSEKIYENEYTSFNESIANQIMKLDDSYNLDDEFMGELIDPEYPLVVCMYDGIQETFENEFEADIITDVVLNLREMLLNENGELYKTKDELGREFWSKGLSIITPHNAQIRLIQGKLMEADMLPPYTVGTVDKMQGQESDVAIIGYGIADKELAELEADFIYSMNRMNVSLSRAKKKAILLISKKVINPPITLLANDDLVNGIQFITSIEQHAQQYGEKSEYILGDANLTLYRIKNKTHA